MPSLEPEKVRAEGNVMMETGVAFAVLSGSFGGRPTGRCNGPRSPGRPGPGRADG